MEPIDPSSDTRASRARRKDARPGELTAAALALFVEKGFAATRLDEVAARAGVSKGTLYLYFDSKESLFKAVISEGIVPVLEQGEAMLDEPGCDPVQLLRDILFGWWELVGNTPLGGIPKLMMSEARNFPELAAYYNEAVIERGHVLVRTALSRGVEAGAFRPLDPDLTVTLLMAPLLHLAIWRHSFASCCSKGRQDPAAYLETYFDLILTGLCVSRPNPEASR